MKKFNIAVPNGGVASTPEEAFKIASSFSQNQCQWILIPSEADPVVKAQVLAGGRGLGHFDNGFRGGVHMASECRHPPLGD